MYRRDFEGLLVVQGGKKPGEPRCQHGLARTGRTDHEKTVAAGCGYFESALCVSLAFHFCEVRIGRRSR
jgi:hypothetical protein